MTQLPPGAPVRLTDAAGRVVWEAAYAPFGAARVSVGEVAQPWRRPGQYADAETGLYYNRLRYYDPALGRYLTPDPAGLLGGSHAYRYAHNGPTWDADPLGLWPSWGTIAAIAASVVVAVAVVALAPAALGVGAILLAGVAAGATFGFLNEGLNHGFGCPSCLLASTLKGAVVGGLAAVPFVFLPAAAGVAAFAGAGAVSGGIGYTADWALDGADPKQWSWKAFAGSVAFGAVTAGAGRYLAPIVGPKVASWWKGEGAEGPAPRDLANPLNYRVRVDPNKLGSNLGNVDVDYVGPRGITADRYEWLRARTPSTALRRAVNRGVTLPMEDPALPGQQITKPLQADHIVSMDRISRMDGFSELTPENQLRVLNDPDNFVGLSEAANKSKGAKSFADWTEHKGLGVDVDPAFRDRMMQVERDMVPKLRSRIQQLLTEQQPENR